MAGTEEEFQEFVAKNRELIEKIMVLQKEGVIEVASAGRDAVHDAAHAADAARDRAEEFAKATYSMFMDPEVQKHFMAMGMELFMGLSAMMQKAPVPDFVREAAGSTERNWKDSACKANDQCGRAKVQKVEINRDDAGDGPSEIKVTDYTKSE